MEQRPNVALGHLLHWSGDLAGARACYRAEYDRAMAAGTQANLPLLLWGMAETEAWAGDWARAGRFVADGYELLKQFTRGQAINGPGLRAFIETLPISTTEKLRLQQWQPQDYVGLAAELARKLP